MTRAADASIAKILVPMTGGKQDALALAAAFRAAEPFHAHVEALFAFPDPSEALPYIGVPLTPDVVQTIVDGQEQVASAEEKRAREIFSTSAGAAGAKILQAPARSASTSCSFRRVTGPLPAAVLAAARLSDLVVFAALPGFVDVIEAFLEVLTEGRRPVLLAPLVPQLSFARHVAIGWNGSAACAHALMAAVPYLCRAEAIEIFCVHSDARASGVDEAKAYLEILGLACTVRSLVPDTRPIGDLLAGEAAKAGADLLVIGGYGHSHLRETIFGGVTAHVLSHATMPIFLSH